MDIEKLTILERDQEFFDMLFSEDFLDLTDLTKTLPPSLEETTATWAPYLTDGDIRDYGHYLCWLKDNGYTLNTANEYRTCLHKWREGLEYNVTIEQINRVLRKARSKARHQTMISALKSYARYRHQLGDSTLYAMIMLSQALLKPGER